MLIRIARETPHTRAHTYYPGACMRACSRCVSIELGVSGKPSDWESGRLFTFLGQGL